MKKLLAATMLSGLLAAPALAQDQEMTCSEFTALDAAAQADALASLDGATGSGDLDTDTTASTTMETDADTDTGADMSSDSSTETGGAMDVTAEAVLQACAGNPDMTVQEAKQQVQAQ